MSDPGHPHGHKGNGASRDAAVTLDFIQSELVAAMRAQVEGHLLDAKTRYQGILHLHPDIPEAWDGLGVLALQENTPGDAVGHFQRAVELRPHEPRYRLHLSSLLARLSQSDDAIAWLEPLLARTPPVQDAVLERLRIALTRHETRWLADDAPSLIQACGAGITQPLLEIIITLDRAGATDAILLFYHSLHRVLAAPLLLFLPGYTALLAQKGELQAATALLDISLLHWPDDPKLWHQLGVYRQRLGDIKGALDAQSQAHRLDPNDPEAAFETGKLLLMTSHFKKGFDEYDARHRLPGQQLPELQLPRWRGEPMHGKRLLIIAEQGIGDVVMFAGMLPALDSLSPAHVTMAVTPRLSPFLGRSYPHITFQPHEERYDENRFDVWAPIGDLPRYCLSRFTPARDNPHFLKPDAEQMQAANAELVKLGTSKKIGISWRTTADANASVRNIPLHLWAPLLTQADAQFVSLQHGSISAEAEAFRMQTGITVHQLPDYPPGGDLDRFASLIASLDAVITAQNANAHLAGGLGVPTLLLLSAASDFRWLDKGEENLWYESVTLLRQEQPMQWEKELQQATVWLKNIAIR